MAENPLEKTRTDALPKDIIRVAIPEHETVEDLWRRYAEHPYRGREKEFLTNIPEQSFKHAYSDFPEFHKAGLSEERTVHLMKAIICNEISNYKNDDILENMAVKLGLGDRMKKLTLGLSQRTPMAVVEMAQELQEEFSSGKRGNNPMNSYLTEGLGDIAKALEDPTQAPLFVAGTLAHVLKMYDRHNVPITGSSLGYGYNPDVYFQTSDKEHNKPLSRDEAKGISVTPAYLPDKEILDKSRHAANIQKWLDMLN